MYVQIISMVLYTLEEIYDDFCFTNTMNKMGTQRLQSGYSQEMSHLSQNFSFCVIKIEEYA